jgi:kynurenine formamidase
MRVRRTVDLSVALDDTTPVYPGDPRPRLRVHSTVERDGFNLLAVELGSQTGTHVDAPFHIDPGGERVDVLDLSLFAGPAVVVDAVGLVPRARIGWERFAGVQERLGPGVIVLLHTGWDAHWGTEAARAHPFLDAGACRRLLDLGVRTVFVDAFSLDETPDSEHPGEGFPVHHLVAGAGGVIGENFRNFALLTWEDVFVTAFPIKLRDADGAPVRAVAMELGPS